MSNEMGSYIDKYWFESELEKRGHDEISRQYTQQAQAINEVIRPYIVNSVKKIRYTKGQGSDTYNIPCLHVRLTNDDEDNKSIPHYVMEAMIVNPNTGIGFIADMPIGYKEKITSLDFAIFAEHCKNAIFHYNVDKGTKAKEGIIYNGK